MRISQRFYKKFRKQHDPILINKDKVDKTYLIETSNNRAAVIRAVNDLFSHRRFNKKDWIEIVEGLDDESEEGSEFTLFESELIRYIFSEHTEKYSKNLTEQEIDKNRDFFLSFNHALILSHINRNVLRYYAKELDWEVIFVNTFINHAENTDFYKDDSIGRNILEFHQVIYSTKFNSETFKPASMGQCTFFYPRSSKRVY